MRLMLRWTWLALAIVASPALAQVQGSDRAPGSPAVLSIPTIDGPMAKATVTVSANASGAIVDPPGGVAYQLLTNASASGPVISNIHGDGYAYNLTGTFGGTSAVLSVTNAAGTLVPVVTCTAACTVPVNIGQGSSVQVTLTGGTPSNMNAKLGGLGGPVTALSTPIGTYNVGQVPNSIAATGTVTASGVTSASGTTPTFASGAATIPFTPDLGAPIFVGLYPASGAAFSATFTWSTDGCTTQKPLTVGQSPYTVTAAHGEYVFLLPRVVGATLCQSVTTTSGSVSYEDRN